MQDTLIIGISILSVVIGFTIAIAALALWLWMLIDVIKRDMQDKALWILLMVFAGGIGSIAYYFSVYRKEGPAK